MMTTLTVEGFLGMSLIMAAMFVANLSAVRMFNCPWRESGTDKTYIEAIAAPYFIYLAAGTSVVVLSFLAALISLFAPGVSPAQPQTLGMDQESAALLFYGSGAMAVLAGAGVLGIFRKAASITDKNLVPLAWISGAFASAGAVYALLAVLLVMSGTVLKVNADFVAGGIFVLMGSVIGGLSNEIFRGWLKRELEVSIIDKEALTNGVMKRTLVTLVLAGVPIVNGIVIIAS